MFRPIAMLVLLAVAAGAGATVPGLQDPTRPLRSAAPVTTPGQAKSALPVLESVLIGPGRRVAVIDGQPMTEGEERRGVKVWRIRTDGVVVSVNGSPRMTLQMTNARMHKEPR